MDSDQNKIPKFCDIYMPSKNMTAIVVSYKRPFSKQQAMREKKLNILYDVSIFHFLYRFNKGKGEAL